MLSLQRTAATASLLAVACQAQTAEEIAAYPEYAELFGVQNLTWESVKVRTERGFHLTAFHITGSTETGPFEVTRPRVVMQHGMGGSAASYLSNYLSPESDILMKKLAMMGFDVWMANNSGTQYSQENDLYTFDDYEYWAMDWSTYGVYDLPALVEEIQRRTGVKKVAMIGHSQGTTQTFAGMGLIPEWYDENISIAALWGPCTSPTTTYLADFY